MDLDNEYVKKLREIVEATSVWRPTSAQDEPITKLYHWSVYQVELPSAESHTIHFVGWTGIEGRVSSPFSHTIPSRKKEFPEVGESIGWLVIREHTQMLDMFGHAGNIYLTLCPPLM